LRGRQRTATQSRDPPLHEIRVPVEQRSSDSVGSDSVRSDSVRRAGDRRGGSGTTRGLPQPDDSPADHPKVAELRALSIWSEITRSPVPLSLVPEAGQVYSRMPSPSESKIVLSPNAVSPLRV